MLARRDHRLDSVQILRALAALMIVFAHAEAFVTIQAEARGLSFRPLAGLPLGAGVDLFFVISGFIIVFASERFFATRGGAGEFLKRRLCRIVPLYWFATVLTLAMLWRAHAAGTGTAPSLAAIAASLAFVPYDAMGYGPRYPFPVMDLGWTLNYEMLFYALFALVIWMPRAAAGLATAAILLAGVLVVWMWPPESVPLWFWFQPIVLEFALGIGIALLFRRGVRLAAAPRAGLIVIGVSVWLCLDPTWFDPTVGPGQYGWPRLFIQGGGAALILAGAVLGATEFRSSALRSVSRLGDSSYALYLLHPFVIQLVRIALKPLPLSEAALWPLVGATVLAAIVVAHGFHRAVEKPFVDRLQRGGAASGVREWFLRRRRSPGVDLAPR